MARKKKCNKTPTSIKDRNKIVEDAQFLISLFKENRANVLEVINMDKNLKESVGVLDPFWKPWKDFVKEAAKAKNK